MGPGHTGSMARDVDGFPYETWLAEQKAQQAAAIAKAKAAAVPPEPGWWTHIEPLIFNWAPIIFMGLLVFFIWSLSKRMPKTKPQEIKPDSAGSIKWDEVAGADEAKAELQEVVDFLKDPKRFRDVGAKVPKGIILHGPPGTGKTLLAKAVANESGAQFFAQSAASFVEMFAGLGAARIRRLFAEARKHAPAIVFIDEIDAVGARRGSDNNSEREQTLNQLLVELDGFSAAGDVVVIAASNLLDKLDPALLRPGRFDRQVLVSPPDVKGRRAILKVHTRNKPLGADVDFEKLSRRTAGLTGAELANICNEAAIVAARDRRKQVHQSDFDHALERVVAGMESPRTLNEHERSVIAYHEAGHALCAELLPRTTRTHRISIVARGEALGYTLHFPDEDRYLDTRADLMDELVVTLGGRAAEQIVFGTITNGAANDLFKVADKTRKMIHEWAMGTTVSALQLAAEGGAVSDRTRALRDAEQQHLADDAMRRALRLISDHRVQLDALAEALLAHEVLEREDIEAIMAGVAPIAPPQGGLTLVAAAQRRLGSGDH
jgi:cell division protease FtsH